tara:strand:+ start:6254 stop:6730 length:477 start_codon:yes stop_codon:yes gene_type:complete
MPQMIRVPGLENTWQLVKDCDIFPREKTGIATLVFYNAWRLKFGDHDKKVWRILNTLMVEWSQEHKTLHGAFSMDGQPVSNVRISGWARTRTWIWVHVELNDNVCNTSFAHELVHIAIWAVKGTDGDPDHLGHKYTGWSLDHNILIQEVNTTLCGLGI